jgi:hypothetical protein
MYFWRIEKLKSELALRPLSEREALPYFIAFLLLSTIAANLPQSSYSFWDGVSAAWCIGIAVLGTIYIYRQNGGRDGQHFLQRYFAISWVMSLRLIAFVVAVAIVILCATLCAAIVFDLEPPEESVTTQWYEFLFGATLEVFFCWRVGRHVRDVARRSGPQSIPLPAGGRYDGFAIS